MKYHFEKLEDLELDTLDTHIVFNQFEKPMTDSQSAYRNQITNMFLNNEVFKPFINPHHLSRSNMFRKYINKRNYQLDDVVVNAVTVFDFPNIHFEKAFGNGEAFIHQLGTLLPGEYTFPG